MEDFDGIAVALTYVEHGNKIRSQSLDHNSGILANAWVYAFDTQMPCTEHARLKTLEVDVVQAKDSPVEGDALLGQRNTFSEHNWMHSCHQVISFQLVYLVYTEV